MVEEQKPAILAERKVPSQLAKCKRTLNLRSTEAKHAVMSRATQAGFSNLHRQFRVEPADQLRVQMSADLGCSPLY